jgi:hypothetical protein
MGTTPLNDHPVGGYYTNRQTQLHQNASIRDPLLQVPPCLQGEPIRLGSPREAEGEPKGGGNG